MSKRKIDSEKDFGKVHIFKNKCGKEVHAKTDKEGKGLSIYSQTTMEIEQYADVSKFSLGSVKHHRAKIKKLLNKDLDSCKI